MFNNDNTTYTTEQLTLMLGDCLDRMKELESGSIDCVIADLPYQITACKWDIIIPFEPMWTELRRICKPNTPMIFYSKSTFHKYVGDV